MASAPGKVETGNPRPAEAQPFNPEPHPNGGVLKSCKGFRGSPSKVFGSPRFLPLDASKGPPSGVILWMDEIHFAPLETMVGTITFVGTGNESFQGFLGGAMDFVHSTSSNWGLMKSSFT